MLQVRLNHREYKLLRAIAKHEGMSMSDWVRYRIRYEYEVRDIGLYDSKARDSGGSESSH